MLTEGNFSSSNTDPDCFSFDHIVTPPQDTCVSLEGMNGLKYRFQEQANSFGKRKFKDNDTGEFEYVTDYDTVPIIGRVCFCQTENCTEATAGTGEVTASTGSPESIMMTTDSGSGKHEIVYTLVLLFAVVAFVLLS